MANHLERLAAEWYEYQGYFVRRNVLVGPRLRGGYEGELDVVAFSPEKKHLVHIEASLDADSWATREYRFKKKFSAGRKYIPKIFKGLKIPKDIEQIALLVFASKQNHQEIAGGKLVLASEFLNEIMEHLSQKKIAQSAVPENLALIRTLQLAMHARPNPIKAGDVLNACECGCGNPVRRRFAQGHDAKLKSKLLKVVRFSANSAEAAEARKRLKRLGWAKFIS